MRLQSWIKWWCESQNPKTAQAGRRIKKELEDYLAKDKAALRRRMEQLGKSPDCPLSGQYKNPGVKLAWEAWCEAIGRCFESSGARDI